MLLLLFIFNTATTAIIIIIMWVQSGRCGYNRCWCWEFARWCRMMVILTIVWFSTHMGHLCVVQLLITDTHVIVIRLPMVRVVVMVMVMVAFFLPCYMMMCVVIMRLFS